MWIFITLAVLGLIVAVCFTRDDIVEGIILSFLVLSAGAGCAGLIGIPLSAATSGLFPDYGKGERVGYIVKTSTKGIIWKTNEIQMQTGTGNIASVEGTYAFSVSSESIFKEIEGLGGESIKVRVKYNQWLIMPYRLGETNRNITSIEKMLF